MDVLKFYFDKYSFIPDEISRIAIGDKYLGVKLQNGQIGVCSCLRNKIDKNLEQITEIDLDNLHHRIIYQAYLNAKLNYNHDFSNNDIFDEIDFKKYPQILMIGYFKSLVNKFEKSGINLFISDMFAKGENIIPPNKQTAFIKESNAIILTSTAIFNNTFQDIISKTENSDVFLLGPSGILDRQLFEFKDVKIIFGSIFKLNDDKVLDIIDDNGGTKSFMHLMQKVYLRK